MAKYDSAGLAMIPSGYKASKVYSLIPNSSDGDFDFARSSSATRVNKDGLIETVATNVPRLDYPLIDGVVQDTPSLLLEPSRTNLNTYSDDFTDSSYGKTNATITANTAISPDGSQNADTITDDATSGNHRFIKQISGCTIGQDYTYSIFLKKGTMTTAIVNLFSGSTIATASVDLEAGTILGTAGVNHKIEDYGNDWYRCSITGTAGDTSVYIYAYLNQLSAYSGVGDTMYLYGAQLEQGSYATSYIPTAGSTVTRAAETCNGAGTSADFNDSEGVLFWEAKALVNVGNNESISLGDGTNNEVVRMRFDNANNQFVALVRDGGSATASTNFVVPDITTFNKVAYKYKSGGSYLWINGFSVDSSADTFSLSGLSEVAFDEGDGTQNVYGNTKQLITFKQALTDAELEDLTSWDTFNEMATQQLYTIE